MENIILQTKNISKSYHHFKALDDISITLQKGHIYGFIGENGAGKTTLMRILTGLSLATDGSYSLFGKEVHEGKRRINHEEMQHIKKRIGSMIEEPALYSEFSAYRNIELQRILVGNPDKSVCDELLKLLDLYDVRDKKVRNFSMGMKQRLSIALTLVGKPELLILDEPINGLDPKNISALRTLLKKLNEERGITMLISSHILNELYLLATDYIIIYKGRIIENLSHDELEAKCENYVKICTDSLPQCITVIEKELGVLNYKVIDDNTLHIYAYTEEPQKISQALTQNDIVIRELSVCGQSLEEYFLSVTGGRSDD
ncbi:MAG: ABC transporter ATP-binding protein [Clostridiales bacterium]|nr:ABC transporter ATP-binding protein [Clostridiales bacterium]